MSDSFKDLQDSIAKSAALLHAPTDHALMRQAEEKAGYDLSAVTEEYNRLMWEKLRPKGVRGFLSRILGR
jgi:hypothetical protein